MQISFELADWLTKSHWIFNKIFGELDVSHNLDRRFCDHEVFFQQNTCSIVINPLLNLGLMDSLFRGEVHQTAESGSEDFWVIGIFPQLVHDFYELLFIERRFAIGWRKVKVLIILKVRRAKESQSNWKRVWYVLIDSSCCWFGVIPDLRDFELSLRLQLGKIFGSRVWKVGVWKPQSLKASIRPG